VHPMAMHARGVVVSGHMIDRPDRPRPRFPAHQIPRVTAAVRRAFAEWAVDPPTTVITGGARGGDISPPNTLVSLSAAAPYSRSADRGIRAVFDSMSRDPVLGWGS